MKYKCFIKIAKTRDKVTLSKGGVNNAPVRVNWGDGKGIREYQNNDVIEYLYEDDIILSDINFYVVILEFDHYDAFIPYLKNVISLEGPIPKVSLIGLFKNNTLLESIYDNVFTLCDYSSTSEMFKGCSNLKYISDKSGLVPHELSIGMFESSGLDYIPKLDYSKIVNALSMFEMCCIKNIPMGIFSKAINLEIASRMFYGSPIETMEIGLFRNSNKLKNIKDIFDLTVNIHPNFNRYLPSGVIM